jgi:hypothetical protein
MTTTTLRSFIPHAEKALAALGLAEPVLLKSDGFGEEMLWIGNAACITEDESDPQGRYGVFAECYDPGNRETPPEYLEQHVGTYRSAAEAVVEVVLVVARQRIEAAGVREDEE